MRARAVHRKAAAACVEAERRLARERPFSAPWNAAAEAAGDAQSALAGLSQRQVARLLSDAGAGRPDRLTLGRVRSAR